MNGTRRAFIGTVAGGAVALAASKVAGRTEPQFYVAALTMLDRTGKFDDALNKDYLTFLAKGGADGVLGLGTTGEFPSFSIRERKQVLESIMKHKGKLSVIAHVGTSNVPETIELLEHATHLGVEKALVIPPYYFKNPSVEALALFYEPILKAAKIPVMLYNIPQMSGAAITPELLRRLSSFERLHGIKDSFSKADVMTSFIKEFPKLKVITGVPGNIETNLKEGGAGTITGNGSVFVRETAAIFAAHRSGGDVHAAQMKFNETAKSMGGYDSIPGSKFVMSLMGMRESPTRPPLLDLTDEKKREAVEKFKRKG
ncbi:MAG: dihydrodipicolinate synthase family protein [Bryobacteraceae bacterium]